MGIGEGGLILGLVLVAGIQTLFSVGLWMWGRRVAKRQGEGRWRLVAYAPLVALGLAMLGACTSVIMLVISFGASADVAPAHKSAVLAQQISEAMNISALFALPALALYLASVVVFIVGSVKEPQPSHESL